MVNKEKKQHPSIQQFKQFVNKHPGMIHEVRNGDYTWQDFYEEWYLLGEDDPRWEAFLTNNQVKEDKSEREDKIDWTSQFKNILKKVDPDQVEQQIHHLSEAIGAIQGVLAQFQNNQGSRAPKQEQHKHPFYFRKD